MGEDERADVVEPAPDAIERAGQELPMARQAGVDDGDALVVGEQVPVDVGVADPEHAADYPYWIVRSTFAGAPAAIERGGRSVVTTELAPITQRSPIVTPLVMTTLAPHQTLSPMRVGPFEVKPCQGTGRSGSSKRWLPSVMKQPLANMQWSPISTSSTEATITAMLRKVPDPIRMRAS